MGKLITLLFGVMLTMCTTPAFAGVQVFNGTTNLGLFSQIKCSSGVTCSNSSGKMLLVGGSTSGAVTFGGAVTLTGGLVASAATKTIWPTWNPGAVANATSATPAATSAYMSQIHVPHNQTATGIGVLNAATVGTNKYIVVLFDSTGAVVANSALAGVTTSGASVFQKVAFTAPLAITGPKTYWLAIYMNGTTDRYYAIPTLGQMGGLAGEVTGQTFGTVAAVTLPTTFTADKGPVAYLY